MYGEKIKHDDTCIKVYNPLEPDKDKKLIGSYKNHQEAADAVGIARVMIYKRCGDKQREFSPKLDMQVAIRLAKK